jgi:polysaccharide pyruvyl transferase WcaK-like protein
MKSRPRLLLLGYSGKKNFGDDLLLKQAYDAFHEIAEIHIHTSMLDQNSDYLYSWFPEATIYKSVKLGQGYLKSFSHILFFGGGILFNYNKIDLKYYWRKRLSILKNYNWVKRNGTHFAGIGIGLGPFVDYKAEDLCFRQLHNFGYLNVRDHISLELCKTYKLNNVSNCEDLSLTNYQYFHSLKIPIEKREKKVIICPRKYPHGKNKERYLKNLFAICQKLESEGKQIFVYGFQSCHDEDIIQEFENRGYNTAIWNPDKMTLENIVKEFAACELIITARMHGLYISGMLDVPVIGIGVHPKLKIASGIFSQSLCLSDVFEMNEMEEAIEKLKKLPENNFDLLSNREKECKEQYALIRKWLAT